MLLKFYLAELVEIYVCLNFPQKTVNRERNSPYLSIFDLLNSERESLCNFLS